MYFNFLCRYVFNIIMHIYILYIYNNICMCKELFATNILYLSFPCDYDENSKYSNHFKRTL